VKIKALLFVLAITASACAVNGRYSGHKDGVVTISILGTNDVHGELLAQPGRGGLTTLSGYVAALRAARAADNGGMLLIDAGDMWQGTLESNLSEGATVVEAYNALGYTAAAIGNHEFDFGPAGPAAIPQSNADDARSALKRRATEANFPLLAANLIDTATNQPVDWPSVKPSVMVKVAGVRVGIVGVMTANALNATIAANVRGLRVAPLSEAIIREATALRVQGAALVIVSAHAGSRCEEFDDPMDLSSCNLDGEIMRVAGELPRGLVDHIIAGHVHQRIAHIVNGVAITSTYSNTRAFSRVDFTLDRTTGVTRDRVIFRPHPLCALVNTSSGQCAGSDESGGSIVAASYEGQQIVANAEVLAIANRAEAFASERKVQELGVYLATPITRAGRPESVIGNLMTDAMLEASDADIAIHNVQGGIRADLPQGQLTYGSLYQMFPFDNQLLVLALPGSDVRRVIGAQVHNVGRRAGFSGMRVFVDCEDDQMSIAMFLTNGREIQDDEIVRVAMTDYLALGGDSILQPVLPDAGFEIPSQIPLTRDVLEDWFTSRGGQLRADQFLNLENPRWNLPEQLSAGCSL